jgi:FG-GAP-like repeat/Bacterial Ig-like domain (group 3)
LNDGGRAFASPAAHSVLPPAPHLSGPPVDLAVADFNGDGHADAAVTVSNDKMLATFTGTGSGSLNPPVFVFVGSTPAGSSSVPRFLAAADFDGDGRPDLAVTGAISLAVWRNVSGDLSITLRSDTPTITAGQTATFGLMVQTAQASFSAPVEPPAPTGTITLKRGEVELGTFPIQCCDPIEVAGIPLGTHAVTAHYAGDGSYRAVVSPAVEQTVVAEAVTVTLTSSGAGREVPYREAFHVTAGVTSPLAGSSTAGSSCTSTT